MLTFGTGSLFGIDSTGASHEFGAVADVGVGFSWDTKEMYGQFQSPVAIGRGKQKVQMKATHGQFYAAGFNLLFGGALASNARKVVKRDTLEVVDTNATATATDGTITQDLGVYDVSNPQIAVVLNPVLVAPAAGAAVPAGSYYLDIASGEYTVPAGTKSIYVSYEMSVASGKTITLGNPLMGTAPIFGIYLGNESNGSGVEFKFNCCVGNKLDFGFKNDDFLIPNFEFSAFADATNTLAYVYMDA